MLKKKSDASGQTKNGEEAQFKPFSQISNACLFFEANNLDDYQRILSFIPLVKGEVQEMKSVVFYHGKKSELVSEDSLHLIGKKDFNLFKKKRADLKSWLESHEYEMLICFTEGNRSKSEQIIRDIKAKIRVGPNFSGKDQYFNISIGKPGEKLDYTSFYEQVKYYFSQLNIKINQ